MAFNTRAGDLRHPRDWTFCSAAVDFIKRGFQAESEYEQPDCNYMEKELRKVGVTLQLLWSEYCDRAHANGKRPYMYSRYCDHYRAHSQKSRATMHIKRTPGEGVEVDWAGKTGYLKDPVSGELVPVYIYVFQYISQKLNVKLTSSLIEIYKADTRITSHRRLQGRKGQYQTVPDHMPAKHQKYLEWDKERFLSWADHIGNSTRKLIQLVLGKYAIPQQGFRSCFGILKLGDNGNEQLLEQTSTKVLSYTDAPSYKLVKAIFKEMKNQDIETVREVDPSISHAFIRNLRGDIK